MATTLLLADDSPTIAKILLLALQSEEYVIKSVLTAEDALHELKANPPYFFLCDLTLPGKNGYEFARLIRHDSKLNKIRVVLLASAFEPVDEVEFQACGADGLIKKPFDPSELRSKLRSIYDAPAKYPDGAKVTGSLSGFLVTREQTNPSLMMTTDPAPSQNAAPVALASAPVLEPESGGDLASLLQGNGDSSGGGDADSILAGLLGGGDSSAPPVPETSNTLDLMQSFQAETPPAFNPPASAPSLSPMEVIQQEKTGLTDKTFTNATVLLDLSDEIPPEAPPAAPQGISASFATPPGGTALIDMSLMGGAMEAPPPSPPPGEALSANAQALAAFFAAEIQGQESSKQTAAPAPAKPSPSSVTPQPLAPQPKQDENFESSLGSIEWNEGPGEASLNAWSSSQPKASDAPPPFQVPAGKTSAGFVSAPTPQAPPKSPPPAAASPTPRRAPTGSGASIGGSMLFDTGGSTFRFSEDYVNRITKSFTGAHGEEVPEAHTAAPMFHQKSDDAAPAAPAAIEPSGFSGGGAWSDADVARIEQIVREEVQMVVREVAEKIAWEVIPELAENLIRKELDKVLKEMEPSN